MPRLIIACPVYKREWIIQHWFEHIEKQTFPLSDIGFIFELGTNDDGTEEMLFNWHAEHPEVGVFDASINTREKHSHHVEGQRSWNRDKYETMVEFRNALLEKVRCHAPEKYFSLDSDVLLSEPTTIQKLWDLTEREDVDAVAPLMYMTPTGKSFPSMMSWTPQQSNRALRDRSYPIGKLFQVDIIMAAKMMSRHVYERINYRFHVQGEDLGWSSECGRAGYKLWSASDIYAPHIMSEKMLEEYLENGDDRAP